MVTALTVQNSLGVQAVHPVAPEVVAAQLDALLSDFPVHAVKMGMLATGAIVRVSPGGSGISPSGPPWCWTRCWRRGGAARCWRKTGSLF